MACEVVEYQEMKDWWAKAQGGDSFIYATACGNQKSSIYAGDRSTTSVYVRELYHSGWADLVQRRNGPFDYEYIIVKRNARAIIPDEDRCRFPKYLMEPLAA